MENNWKAPSCVIEKKKKKIRQNEKLKLKFLTFKGS